MNNSSLYAADRVTHLKIVAVSLVASIVFLVVAIAARTSLETGYIASGPALKAGQPMAVTHGDHHRHSLSSPAYPVVPPGVSTPSVASRIEVSRIA